MAQTLRIGVLEVNDSEDVFKNARTQTAAGQFDHQENHPMGRREMAWLILVALATVLIVLIMIYSVFFE